MKIDWQPSASVETLKRRAQLLADVRLFFAEHEVLEVETPVLSSAAPTAPYLDSFQTDFIPLGSQDKHTFYLQTSPEFAMKRLLAAGSGSIYQIAKVFRNGESGRQHSPEFTMLEWYRPELTLFQLMDEVNDLVQQVFNLPAALRFSYRGIFELFCKFNVFNCSDDEIRSFAIKRIIGLPEDLEVKRDGWLELIMSYVIEPRLAAMNMSVFIYDFPASQAQLAKVTQDNSGNKVAKRFELYAGGMELANGYDELLDAEELRQRFEDDNQQRELQNKPRMPIDENLLAAMESGLPQCTGVALGLDRLMMLMLNKQNINAVKTFKFEQS
ncbi:EF-P lysine aminoacylase GenX [Methylophaga sp. 42_25_T18]|nr:EF-P lysine aminoacylase GenX [Methylophaga sp. 42_25_T18]OUR89762.1 EF-P lysine aminoacylase GenX [Methylophaga sp. 42_8_T64]